MVVDDQELVRVGFIMILNSQDDIDVVGEAANGSDAVDAVAASTVSNSEVIAQFAERPLPSEASQELERLTDREAEVLRLMAKGLSNSEIAEQLY